MGSYHKIYIWHCSLDQSETVRSAFYSILSAEEKIRSGKFKFDELKDRWIVSRGVLRLLLANYVQCQPSEIKLTFNKFGKPLLSETVKKNHFNLSHSDNHAVYIFSENLTAGIDIEKIKDIKGIDELADLCFSEDEINWFNSIPKEEQKAYFYRIWTSKEAYIKAIGKGFSYSPRKITTGLNAGEGLFFKHIEDDDCARWNLVKVDVHPDFVCYAAVEGNEFETEHYYLKELKPGKRGITYSVQKISAWQAGKWVQ